MNLRGRQNLGGLRDPQKLIKFIEKLFEVVLGQNALFKRHETRKNPKKSFY